MDSPLLDVRMKEEKKEAERWLLCITEIRHTIKKGYESHTNPIKLNCVSCTTEQAQASLFSEFLSYDLSIKPVSLFAILTAAIVILCVGGFFILPIPFPFFCPFHSYP